MCISNGVAQRSNDASRSRALNCRIYRVARRRSAGHARLRRGEERQERKKSSGLSSWIAQQARQHSVLCIGDFLRESEANRRRRRRASRPRVSLRTSGRFEGTRSAFMCARFVISYYSAVATMIMDPREIAGKRIRGEISPCNPTRNCNTSALHGKKSAK